MPETKVNATHPRLHHRGRALIGWMDPVQAVRALGGQRADVQANHVLLRGVADAQDRGAQRTPPELAAAESVVRRVPTELLPYIERLKARPAAKPYFQEGWTVGLADLRYVLAFQPQTVVEGGEQRIPARGASLLQLATVTIPAETESVVLSPSIDATKNVWSLSSDNPNLRIVGQFAGSEGGPPGATALGFFVAQLPSFMQVARVNDRWFLRDGYHRAIALLQAGITLVPTLVRVFPTAEQLIPAGALPVSILLGPRPPLLSDYWDDQVASAVEIPASRKAILIQGLEVGL